MLAIPWLGSHIVNRLLMTEADYSIKVLTICYFNNYYLHSVSYAGLFHVILITLAKLH